MITKIFKTKSHEREKRNFRKKKNLEEMEM